MRALWLDRQNCSHNVSQKVKRIRRLSDFWLFFGQKSSHHVMDASCWKKIGCFPLPWASHQHLVIAFHGKGRKPNNHEITLQATSPQHQIERNYSQHWQNCLKNYFWAQVAWSLWRLFLNNSQNQRQSVNRMSVFLHIQRLRRLLKPELPACNFWPASLLKQRKSGRLLWWGRL